MNEPVIQVNGLCKSYTNDKTPKEVLKNISFEVAKGEIIGYLGSNGAGKSTTVKILCGIIPDYDGDIRILGRSLQEHEFEIKRCIGYIPETAVMYEQLSPIEYLTFIASLYGIEEEDAAQRIDEMLTRFEMKEVADRRMEGFSKGMKQKIHIISGLLHDPEIIFLDEPLNGLDANAVIMIKEMISTLAEAGKTIFYCSHLMDVVEKVASRVILIDGGHIVADGTIEELKKKSEVNSLEEFFAKNTRHTHKMAVAEF